KPFRWKARTAWDEGRRKCRDAGRVQFPGSYWAPSPPFHARLSTAPNGLFNGLIWPKTGFASTASAQQRRHNFLPLPVRAPSFLAEQESSSFAVQPPAARRCASDRLRPVDRHRGRNGAGSKTENGDLKWRPSAPSRRPARTNSPAKSSP